MHKICIIGPCLHMGGVERASATVANYLASRGDRVLYLAIFRHPRFFTLHENVVYDEPEEGKNVDRLSILPTLLRIRKTVRRHSPDAILAFGKGHAALAQIALIGTKTPLYISERSSPLYRWQRKSEIVNRIATFINPPTGVIAQTAIAAEYQRKYYPARSEIRVIPNPARRMKQYDLKRERFILAVGRLSDRLKGFDLLLEAYSKLENPSWKLVFAGSTQGAESLLEMAGKSPNSRNIEFLGNVKEIDALYARAGMFVIPSRSEGFPNALIEALVSGTPCISFDFIAGPSDLIQNGENGILVEPGNTDKLAEAIQDLMNNPDVRDRLGEKARETGKCLDEDIIGAEVREFILQKASSVEVSSKYSVLNVAVMVDKDLPTDHSFIKGVLVDNLQNEDLQVAFVGFRSAKDELHSQNARYLTVDKKSRNYILAKLEKLFKYTRVVLRMGSIDVLYTRNDPVFLIVGWWLKKRKRIRIHLHQISHLQAYSVTESKRSVLFRGKSIGDRLLRRLFMNSADQLLLVSSTMKAFVVKQWPYYKQRLTVYPLGVNPSDFRSPTPYKERTLDVVYIGTLARSRKVDVILEAVRYYNSHFGKVELHIWGRSHNPSDDIELKQYAEKLEIADVVHFNGHISRDEVIERICDSRIGLSTIPAEGLLKQISPTKLMEYMAAGCPVIASRGIPEQGKIINESGGGIIVDYNAKEIAEAIRSLLNNPDIAEEMAAKGREYILKNRSYISMAADLRADIQDLLDKRSVANLI